jgi:HD-GYP domain-containing protein (c-di-GMP phosphodiesterase class II)
MKAVDVTSLNPGTIAETDYCSKDGKVLISKGIEITQKHLDILHRRNIFEVYHKDTQGDDEIKQILSSELPNLEELDLDDLSATSKGIDWEPELEGPAKVLELPEFKNIETGLKGLRKLNNSKRASELDKKFRYGRTPDRPVGPALKDEATEMVPKERTESYKDKMTLLYDIALNDVKRILNSLANGNRVDGQQIRRVVNGFVNTFITDRNILLNLSTKRCKDTIYIYSHSLNVCLLSINIAASAGYNREQVIEIGMGALLYDVGMLLISREIFSKKERLNKDEWFEIQKHPILGLHLLESVSRLPESIPYIAYQSHERENATGYPKQRDKRLIHCFSKIIQIADIFIALSSPRSYREEYMPYKAMEAIIKMTKKGLISGEFVKSFLTYTSLFPVGSLVELNDKRIGKVIKSNDTSFAKPVVSVLTNENGNTVPQSNIYQIDLSEDIDKHIVKALKVDYLSDVALMDGF